MGFNLIRFPICLAISFQLVTGVLAQELGEGNGFSSKDHLLHSVAKLEAKKFEQSIRKGLKDWNKGHFSKISPSDLKLNAEDTKAFSYLLKTSQVKVRFDETGPGNWAARVQGHVVSFSLKELYLGKMKIDGKVFDFKGASLSEVQKRLNEFELPPQTTFFDQVFNNTFGISDAHAIIPFIILGVIAGVIILYTLYELKWKPEATVEKLDELTKQLEKSVTTCEESKTSESSYRDTFQMATKMSERSTLNSATSSEDALMLALKEQISSGTRSNEDCYKLMHETGEKLDIDVPMPTTEEIQKMNDNGGGLKFNTKVDVKGALYNLCKAYNNLGSCMEQFVGVHVDSSDVDNFKDSARENYRGFKKATGAGRQ